LALTHLVDTSVLRRLGQPAVRAALEPLAAAGLVGRTAITDLEMGEESAGPDTWDDLAADLEVFALVEVTEEHFRRARQVQRLLVGKSLHQRMVAELLVAASAELAGLVLIHSDAVFDEIRAITGQSCWAVGAGVAERVERPKAAVTTTARQVPLAPARLPKPPRLASAPGPRISTERSEKALTADQTARMSRDEVLELVRTQLADILEISPDKISESSSFTEDLNADSLALIELVESLEEELRNQVPGFRIDDEDLEDLRTVRDAVDYVTAKLEAA
jgi:acyl carrier protein